MVPVEFIIKSPTCEGDFACYKNRYWSTEDGCVLFYKSPDKYLYPQCNRNKSVVERLTMDGKCQEKCEAIFLPVAYVPVEWTDDGNEIDFDMYDGMFDRN